VALPALQDSLGASVIDVQWVVNGYTLFLSALLMLGGSLGDRFGRKRMFVWGVLVFTAASIWCGLAGNVQHLTAARAVQGAGGALLTPGSLALINANFPEDRRGAAIGTWSSFSAIATVAGPVLGGWLIDTLSWRWIFFINVPLAALAVLIALRSVPESREAADGSRPDAAGSLLVTLGLGGLVYALLEGPGLGWTSLSVLVPGSGGAVLLVGFVLYEAHSPNALVPLSLFRSRVFSGINGVTLLLYANLAGLSFFLPMFLIQVRGFSATAAGAASLPLAILLFVASGWSGQLYDRVGPRMPITVGALMTGVAFLLFVLLGEAAGFLVAVTLPMTVMGAGMALVVAPLTTTVMAGAPDALAGTASGINNAVSRVAGLLAIALLGVIMIGVFAGQLDSRLTDSDLPPAAQAEMRAARTDLAGMTLPAGMPEEQVAEARAAIDAAFTAGFDRVLVWMALVAALGAGLAAATLPGKARGPGGAGGEAAVGQAAG